jgi:hypothetical protein
MMGRRKVNIAIFDDSDIDRFIFDRTLSENIHADHRCFVNPEVGLSYSPYQVFDIVIIDLHFWGTRFGIKIRDQWSERCLKKPVFIATSPFLLENESAEIINAGFDYVFKKPAIFSSLDGLILQYIENISERPEIK